MIYPHVHTVLYIRLEWEIPDRTPIFHIFLKRQPLVFDCLHNLYLFLLVSCVPPIYNRHKWIEFVKFIVINQIIWLIFNSIFVELKNCRYTLLRKTILFNNFAYRNYTCYIIFYTVSIYYYPEIVTVIVNMNRIRKIKDFFFYCVKKLLDI